MERKQQVKAALVALIVAIALGLLLWIAIARPWETAPATTEGDAPTTSVPPPADSSSAPAANSVPPPADIGGVLGRYIRVQRTDLRLEAVDVGTLQVFAPGQTPKALLPTAGDIQPLDPALAATAWKDLADPSKGGARTTAIRTGFVSLDLGAPVTIGSVRVVARSQCAECAGRLRGCQVQILDAKQKTVVWAADLAAVATPQDLAVTARPAVPDATLIRGRTVRVKRYSGWNNFLDLGGLLVYDPVGAQLQPESGRILPPYPATGASVWENLSNDDPHLSPVLSAQTQGPLIELDFGATVPMDSIRVLARKCDAPNERVCADRLRWCYVQILDADGWVLWSADLAGSDGDYSTPVPWVQKLTPRWVVPTKPPVRGRFVRCARMSGPELVDVGALSAFDSANVRLVPTSGRVASGNALSVEDGSLSPQDGWRNLMIPDPASSAASRVGGGIGSFVQLDYGTLVPIATVRVAAHYCPPPNFDLCLLRMVGVQLQILDSSGGTVWAQDFPGAVTDYTFSVTLG